MSLPPDYDTDPERWVRGGPRRTFKTSSGRSCPDRCSTSVAANGDSLTRCTLWCLYDVDHPSSAVAEAVRVLRAGGRYFACTSSRRSDPEHMPEGYPGTSFDAEEAVDVVSEHLAALEVERWDDKLYSLNTGDEVEAFCRHNFIPLERANEVDVPPWLTKRGVLIRATAG